MPFVLGIELPFAVQPSGSLRWCGGSSSDKAKMPGIYYTNAAASALLSLQYWSQMDGITIKQHEANAFCHYFHWGQGFLEFSLYANDFKYIFKIRYRWHVGSSPFLFSLFLLQVWKHLEWVFAFHLKQFFFSQHLCHVTFHCVDVLWWLTLICWKEVTKTLLKLIQLQ